ncbi:MAG: hypothetical protein HC831_15375 [Chloroflexia bacterium]|nr:hypothetical protein [Chloroflexia bacterium]
MKLCFLLALLLFSLEFGNTLVAQLPHELPDFKANEKFYFKHIFREDGLPSNRIYCLIQDFLGYMWFGTSNGLVRYDGNKMKVFNIFPEMILQLLTIPLPAYSKAVTRFCGLGPEVVSLFIMFYLAVLNTTRKMIALQLVIQEVQ